MEEWRDIPGYEGAYRISNLGHVYSSRTKRGTLAGLVIKPVLDHKGYWRIGIRRDGKSKTYRVHQLVALAFIGPCPAGCQINHKDGNKQNNRPENLEYVTGKQNMRHAIETGLRDSIQIKGDDNPSAKLTEDQVREIKRLLQETKLSQRAIGELFGVEKSIISLIYCGKNWAHVQVAPAADLLVRDVIRKGEDHHAAKLNETKVREIKALCGQGVRYSLIAKQYGVSPSLISGIALGNRWAHVSIG